MLFHNTWRTVALRGHIYQRWVMNTKGIYALSILSTTEKLLRKYFSKNSHMWPLQARYVYIIWSKENIRPLLSPLNACCGQLSLINYEQYISEMRSIFHWTSRDERFLTSYCMKFENKYSKCALVNSKISWRGREALDKWEIGSYRRRASVDCYRQNKRGMIY